MSVLIRKIVLIAICFSCQTQSTLHPEELPEQQALGLFIEGGVLDSLKKDEVLKKVMRWNYQVGINTSRFTSGITKMGAIYNQVENSEIFFQDYKNRQLENIRKPLVLPSAVIEVLCDDYVSDDFNRNGYYLSVKNSVTDGENFIVQLSIFHRLDLKERLNVFIVLGQEMKLLSFYWKLEYASFAEFKLCE